MSSINRIPTFHYSQPDEYHFSHDSVFLARRVFELTNESELKVNRALDVCAGCGIVGIDFLHHQLNSTEERNKLDASPHFDFVEIQAEYLAHFNENIKRLKDKFQTRLSAQMHICNYESLLNVETFKGAYDLIVCNPPYFDVRQGKLSDSEFKNRCKFFIDSNLRQLLNVFHYGLNSRGKGYVLIPDKSENGLSDAALFTEFRSILKIDKLEKIRSTDLFEIRKIT